MPDREKVIKALEVCIPLDEGENCPTECPYYRDVCYGSSQMMRDALTLLKEQEAVKPILIREGRNKHYNNYVCQGCDNELVYGQNYCSECGRAVNWDED